ncbi:hypothetical protein OHB12_12440 [Nocardia sp. NBC_01730]|uniref:hypothetical protein n=1 Tax=Nocardia sp. NBC_01730 TaxID=2975998 RepID=UPI002E11158D|nr:hypothetical protein OHB12_12440 [Nocardia sp. NBC_01730]
MKDQDPEPIPIPIPIPKPLATLESYTHQALTVGRVELPGRSVHAGVWFRLLRSLLDELSLAVTTVNQPARHSLEQVWDAAELPVRAGISVWAPYEQLPWQAQEKLLTAAAAAAAAAAIALAAQRRIIARGTPGPTLAEPSHESVYAGDDPAQRPVSAWSAFTAAMDEWMCAARTTPGPAQQMLQLLTWYNTSPEKVVRERESLIRQGIPPELLRLDPRPLWGRSVPADEAAVTLVRGVRALRGTAGDRRIPRRTRTPPPRRRGRSRQ